MKTCNKCLKTYKNKDYDSEEHLDEHTPYWIKDEVILSGADQIRLILKNIEGGWKKVVKNAKKHNHTHDIEQIEKLQNFEQLNKIEFIVCGSNVESYRKVGE